MSYIEPEGLREFYVKVSRQEETSRYDSLKHDIMEELIAHPSPFSFYVGDRSKILVIATGDLEMDESISLYDLTDNSILEAIRDWMVRLLQDNLSEVDLEKVI